MKKTLLLLPVAALLLTGCGNDEKEEETNKQPTITEISDAAIGSLASTYKKAVSGLTLNLEVANANVHFVNTEIRGNISQKTDVEVKDFGFKLKLDVRNLTQSIKNWEAAIVLEDLGGKETVKMNDSTVLVENLVISDVDLGLYLKGGNLYANLSDPELKTTANSVIDVIFGPSNPESQQYKAMVEQYAKDLYLENAVDFLFNLFAPTGNVYSIPSPEPEPEKALRGAPDTSDLIIIPPELPTEWLLEIKQELPMILTQIIGPASPFRSAFNFTVNNNLLNKVEVDFNSTMLPPDTFEEDDVNFTASLTANFDNAGALTGITTSETFDVTVTDTYDYPIINSEEPIVPETHSETTHIVGNVSASVAIAYPTSAINMPDFTGYEPFVFPEF